MEMIKLWEQNTPYYDETIGQPEPYLEAYRAQNAQAGAPFVIICPGGAYENLSMDHEGRDVAKMFNLHGIHAAVLIYRLAPYHYPVMPLDILRAVKVARHLAGDWGADPGKIGVMGFSAGGNLALLALTQYGNADCAQAQPDEIGALCGRPDFGILCYGVLSLEDGVTHDVTRAVLIGERDEAALIEKMTCEKAVTEDCPPVFLWHSADDRCVPVENSLRMAAALSAHNVPFEAHIFPHSPHGLGMGNPDQRDERHAGQWTELCLHWMKTYIMGEDESGRTEQC